jgi:hypothetical protein
MSNIKDEDLSVVGIIDEVIEDEAITTNSSTEPQHKCTDSDWVEHILDQLADHELSYGSPTTDGLRRVAEAVFGQILLSDTHILEVPAQALTGKCTAKHRLVFERNDGKGTLDVSACVDVVGSKLPSPFNQHIVATACTRAEGKALRRALKIRVQTAEEIITTEDPDEDVGGEPINDQQILAINQMCKRNNVNALAVIQETAKAAKKLRDVKNIEGRFILTKLAEYQRNQSTISEDLVGYDENWKESFDKKR